MKNLKTFILVSALLLATPFIATTSYASNNNELEQCSPFYQQVMTQPLITREAAISFDQEKAEEIEMVRQIVDQYVMNVNIADLPAFEDIEAKTEALSDEEMQLALASGSLMSKEGAQEGLMLLVQSYYGGQYVSKNEPQAIKYLKKLVDYSKQKDSITTNELNNIVMMTIAEAMLENNPKVTDADIQLATHKALIAAGSEDTEALTLAKDLKRSSSACFDPLLTKLEDLANQGSIYAVGKVAKIYNKLYEDNPEKYAAKMQYWQQQAKDKGLIVITD